MTDTLTTTSVQRPLGVLESSGLIKLAATHPELEYFFRHVLVQDAAYDSLLKQERRRLHLAVADALEQLYPERRAELAAMLAYHLDAAGEAIRALPLLVQAADLALSRYANQEATNFFDRAAEIVPPGDNPALLRVRAQIALGRAASGWLSRPLPASVAIIDEALPLAERLGDQELLGQVLLWRALLLGNSFRPLSFDSDLGRTIDRGLEIADAIGNRNLRGNLLTVLGTSLKAQDPQRAIEVLEEALGITSNTDFIGSSLTADTLVQIYASLGDWERADNALARARVLAERSGDPKAVIDANITASSLELERGNFAAAIQIAKENGLRAEAIGAPACSIVANWIAGTGELAAGRFDDALQTLGHSNQLSIQLDEHWFRNYTDAGMTSARCALGDLEAARAEWERAIAKARELHDPSQEADIVAGRATVLAAMPDPSWPEILADLDRADALYRGLGLRPRHVRVLVERARALDALGRAEAASASRAEAASIGAAIAPDAPGSDSAAAQH